MHIHSKALCVALLATAFAIPWKGLAQSGEAATTQPKDPIEAKGVGISGGIIAGAELSLLVESFIDVKPVWPWIVAPILTAGGGGVGGYYLERESSGGAIALLVSSMALLIPTAIAVSVARAYEIDEDGAKVIEESSASSAASSEEAASAPATTTEVEARPAGIPADSGDERAPNEETAPESRDGISAQRGHRSPSPLARHLASGSLFHFDRDLGAGLGVPSLDVRPVAFGNEASFGAPRQGLEVRLSLLKIELP